MRTYRPERLMKGAFLTVVAVYWSRNESAQEKLEASERAKFVSVWAIASFGTPICQCRRVSYPILNVILKYLPLPLSKVPVFLT